jgi:hypothetical protein
MSKTVRLSESDLTRLIKRVINEEPMDIAPAGMDSSKSGCKKPTNSPCSQTGLKNLDGMIISFGNGMTKFVATNPQTGCPESCIVDKSAKDVFRYVRTKN